MDRTEYLRALDQALAERVPAQERADILRYYQEYFDEAGPEGEAAVIAELGDPRALAQRLAEEGGYGQPAAAPRRSSRGPVVVLAAVILAVVVLALLAIGAFLSLRGTRGSESNSIDTRPADSAVSTPRDSAGSQDPGTSQSPNAPQNTSSAGDGFSSIRGEQFSKVDVEAALADVTILTGEDYAADLEWNPESGYSLRGAVQNGVLKITSSQKTVNDSLDQAAQVVITIPQGVTLREIDVEVGLGDITLEAVAASEVSCETGLGDVQFVDVTATEADGSTGMGDVRWEGALSRETELETGMGDIRVSAAGPANGWSYELESGMGNVEVDGVSLGRSAKQRGGSSGELEASSGMGDVIVTFNAER